MSEENKRAGLLVRTVARILDFIIVVAIIETIPKVGFFAGLTYLLIADGFFDGRSLGKKLIGLRVVMVDTKQSCSFRESILRNSTFGIGFLLYKIPFIGWIVIFLIALFEFIILLGSRDHMRLGDEFAKTIVLEIPQQKQEA